RRSSGWSKTHWGCWLEFFLGSSGDSEPARPSRGRLCVRRSWRRLLADLLHGSGGCLDVGCVRPGRASLSYHSTSFSLIVYQALATGRNRRRNFVSSGARWPARAARDWGILL